MWKHETVEPDDGSETIEYDRLEYGPYWVDVFYMADGRFFVETSADDGSSTTCIGYTDSLAEARRAGQNWLLQQALGLLRAVGAEGVWLLVRGEESTGGLESVLYYLNAPDKIKGGGWQSLGIADCDMVLLARFPAGDGREAGIEMVAG